MYLKRINKGENVVNPLFKSTFIILGFLVTECIKWNLPQVKGCKGPT